MAAPRLVAGAQTRRREQRGAAEPMSFEAAIAVEGTLLWALGGGALAPRSFGQRDTFCPRTVRPEAALASARRTDDADCCSSEADWRQPEPGAWGR